MTLDFVFDILGLIGLSMLAYGLYLVSPVHMFLVMGALLVVFALLASRGTIQVVRPGRKKG